MGGTTSRNRASLLTQRLSSTAPFQRLIISQFSGTTVDVCSTENLVRWCSCHVSFPSGTRENEAGQDTRPKKGTFRYHSMLSYSWLKWSLTGCLSKSCSVRSSDRATWMTSTLFVRSHPNKCTSKQIQVLIVTCNGEGSWQWLAPVFTVAHGGLYIESWAGDLCLPKGYTHASQQVHKLHGPTRTTNRRSVGLYPNVSLPLYFPENGTPRDFVTVARWYPKFSHHQHHPFDHDDALHQTMQTKRIDAISYPIASLSTQPWASPKMKTSQRSL